MNSFRPRSRCLCDARLAGRAGLTAVNVERRGCVSGTQVLGRRGSDLQRALFSATSYFLALFSLGFVLGALRVTLVAPRLGDLGATLAEAPVMLAAAYVFWRWTLHLCHPPQGVPARWVMVLWFLVLLALFETVFGALLFGRTGAEQLSALATPAGLIGGSAQIIAALLPLLVARTRSS